MARKYSIKDFKLGEEPLGTGGFASVFCADSLKLEFPKKVAVKKIEKAFIKRKKIQDRVIKEKYIHKRVDHANIVKCYTTFEDTDFTYLVLELCQYTLEEYLKKEGKICEVWALEIIKQIVSGLHYLHHNGIMHRDLSLRNILVTADNKVKITDFGLSTFKTPSEQLYSIVGTHKYQSPEMHNHKSYDLTSDCWSLGIVILAVLGGEVPSDIKNIEIPEEFSPEAKELVYGLLQEDPKDRWSLEDVMESSFFKKYSPHPMKGNSRTKNGSFRDSGMDSIGTSYATTGKSSHQSQQQLDSGFDCISKSTKSRNNLKISPLSTIHSSGHSCQSNHSKTRLKQDTNNYLIPLERDTKKIATIPNTCADIYPNFLKHSFQTLPSRHTPAIETLPYESIGYTEYTNALSKEHNFHVPFHLSANSDKRERSASEEQRKQERQRIQCKMKKSYSGQAKHSSHHSNSYLEDTKNNLQLGKVHAETSTIKQKPLPLSTERLRPCRYPMKKIAVVSILENGEVCVEWLKTREEKQYVSVVAFISSNGKWIDIFKPHNCLVGNSPPPKPNNNKDINSFPYDDLPSSYWKMYRKAKVLVDFVRATTPRITYYDKDSKCVMMENYPNPDFEMEFFDGGNITQKSSKISITDEWGQTISVAELDRSDKHFAVMWDKFCKMKEWCKNMEAQLEAMKSNGKTEMLPYPVMFGNPPLAKKCNSTKKYLKENINLHSSGDNATSKNKYSYNSYEKQKRTPSNSSNKHKLNS
ncbi:hypothetical protein JTE90_000710 [Oedothorax gibbosus]|uniref:Serine/threonine-protein kinase SAK n=1 Tax=Oedothorax gibbosus TaxID=931172 RepID=A0AAV6UMS8_9ARAC|nr:hypothetical protein JTE90_000710 [Oedothorax gibbosus]